jgi:hypothetical protein
LVYLNPNTKPDEPTLNIATIGKSIVNGTTLAVSINVSWLRCAATPGASEATGSLSSAEAYSLANRLTWGANSNAVERLQAIGSNAYLKAQLQPGRTTELPPDVQAQIDGMRIVQVPLFNLVQDMDRQSKDANALTEGDGKKAAQQAYQTEMNRLAREAATRHLLRALYSPHQVQEQMTWFWLNHFNVHQGKSNPPHGAESPFLAPPHGLEQPLSSPSDGAVRPLLAPSSTPPHGHHLEIPSAAVRSHH